MSYKVRITEKAESDINEALDYIEFHLLNPKAANDLLDKVEAEFTTLTEMPEKHQLIEDPLLSAWGIRHLVINNYVAFFMIDEKRKTVYVIRFLYGKRNWIKILKEEPF